MLAPDPDSVLHQLTLWVAAVAAAAAPVVPAVAADLD